MRLNRLLHYGVLIALSISSAFADVGPLKLTLPSALESALRNNRDVLVSQMSHESDHFLIDAAEAEFSPKLTPSVAFGKTGTQPSFFDGAESTVSYGIQVSKKFSLGTVISAGPSY